ncbi:succinylglutamate desuccinylase/aspartoacylase family protein, partial [Patescibacteria group bacterium]|nr:succinylglutamate desuccinylase/aspartoacylase family protein [Patescibacteria group bacterium]MBU1755267.1 succinylglutamate desuccinylase/aspartoacylase family protein [Patescibacteria group bacterium]
DIDSSSYEYRRVQSLKSLLEECDYFFDLHSASIAQEPFLICEEGPATFFSQLGISKIVTGWNSFSDGVIGGDAENYANNHGAIAATLEAGSHFDPTSIDVAYHAVLTMLSTLNMISLKRDYKLNGGSSEVFEMYHVVIKESEDFRYLVEPKNFLFIPNNTAYAYQGGTELRVTEDSYFIIPVMPENKKLGTEICYLGRKAA